MDDKISINMDIDSLQPAETMTAIDEMKESVKALMEMFRLPSETDFLIYRILKDYRGDFKQASAKIFEAQCELRSWELLREAARGVYPTYYNTAASAAYYYPVGGSAASHPSTNPSDLYNSISSSSNHRINIAV
ncbi:unnamed protein product [Orchesella dallaii]|uniref:Uncharacterized protein n=1 Tax=Orchesella dallaii TaxID=48710 RepID=A0ABP1PSN7_9HEXA